MHNTSTFLHQYVYKLDPHIIKELFRERNGEISRSMRIPSICVGCCDARRTSYSMPGPYNIPSHRRVMAKHMWGRWTGCLTLQSCLMYLSGPLVMSDKLRFTRGFKNGRISKTFMRLHQHQLHGSFCARCFAEKDTE